MIKSIAILRRYNKWRRGDDDIEQINPKLIGEAIDNVCDKLEPILIEQNKTINDFPSTPELNMIHVYSDADKLFLLNRICGEIFIARNISMNQQTILDNFRRIDRLYRTPSKGEEYES